MCAGAGAVKREAGFTLIELLAALALGLVVAGVAMQGLIGSGRGGERLALKMRERTVQRRTLALLRSELAAAESMTLGDGSGAACDLGGRTPVVHWVVQGRPITYSIGVAPSAIWRGQVLMRCGPAYGLAGELSSGKAQNRVVLDGVPTGGLEVVVEAPGLVRLRLKQAFTLGGAATPLQIESEMAGAAPTG
ncbi:MAG: prepilin-type N-terminal cleavage/methylation domain-containing protein [Cyanobacteriota bacterium]|nr:prepilin-type N-terminal cleavage/methylation domain-containing protein [Cyanobacteriota bacterium]